MPSSRVFLPLILLTLLAAVILLGFYVFQGSTVPESVALPAVPNPAATALSKSSASPLETEPASSGAVTGPATRAPSRAAADAPGVSLAQQGLNYQDPYIPMKWRSLPENSPLKKLVRQARLPRSASLQSVTDPAQAEQTLREAASQLPVAFTQTSPDKAANGTTNRQVTQIQDEFIEEVSGLQGNPSGADYQEAWRMAQLKANGKFIGLFGQEAFNNRQMALLRNPE